MTQRGLARIETPIRHMDWSFKHLSYPDILLSQHAWMFKEKVFSLFQEGERGGMCVFSTLQFQVNGQSIKKAKLYLNWQASSSVHLRQCSQVTEKQLLYPTLARVSECTPQTQPAFDVLSVGGAGYAFNFYHIFCTHRKQQIKF